MEELIRQAFLHIEVIGPHVAEGHYDLIGPNGDIILPQVWETVIEPDWTVTMHMWPIPEKPKTPEPAPPPDPPVPEAATASEALPAPEDVVVAVPAEEPKKKSDSTGASYACCFAMEFLKTRPLSGTPLALRLDLCRKLTCLLPRSEKAATKSP